MGQCGEVLLEKQAAHRRWYAIELERVKPSTFQALSERRDALEQHGILAVEVGPIDVAEFDDIVPRRSAVTLAVQKSSELGDGRVADSSVVRIRDARVGLGDALVRRGGDGQSDPLEEDPVCGTVSGMAEEAQLSYEERRWNTRQCIISCCRSDVETGQSAHRAGRPTTDRRREPARRRRRGCQS